MKHLKPLISVLVWGLIFGAFVLWCVYDAKYDEYYAQKLSEKQEEALRVAAADGSLKIKIDIDTIEEEYSHLGNSISEEYTCNGSKIESGDIIAAKRQLSFKIKITEDDSIPDVGTGTATISFPSIQEIEKKTVKTQIRVNEKGGRKYPNAYAIYRVEITAEPVPPDVDVKVGFFEVVFS